MLMRGCFLHGVYGSHGKFSLLTAVIRLYLLEIYYFLFVENRKNIIVEFFFSSLSKWDELRIFVGVIEGHLTITTSVAETRKHEKVIFCLEKNLKCITLWETVHSTEGSVGILNYFERWQIWC